MSETKLTAAQAAAPLGDDPEQLWRAYLTQPDGSKPLNGEEVLVRPHPLAGEPDGPDTSGRPLLEIVWADGTRDSAFVVDAAGVNEDGPSFAGPAGELRLVAS